jgi:hypothetical protein
MDEPAPTPAPKKPTEPEPKPPGDDAELRTEVDKLADLSRKDASPKETAAEVRETLASLETLSWKAASNRTLNLQVVLRRSYEDAVTAAGAATGSTAGVTKTASATLIAAVCIAVLGWLTTVTCVIAHTVFPNAGAPSIRELWPALAATSGAVLLLVGIATLAYRFASRTHGRAMSHFADARETRRTEAAVGLMLMIESEIKPENADGLRAFAAKLLEQRPVSAPPIDPISAVPAEATKLAEKALDTVQATAEKVLAVVKAK